MENCLQDVSEERRLDVLQRLKILDTEEEQIYQDAVVLASQICDTPISTVSLVGGDRQWFKAKIGVDFGQTPRDVSFCTHAIRQTETFVVEDATTDPRFRNNEMVTGDFHLRFYAGSPIYADDEPVGTLCVVGKEPRKISPQQIRALEALARQVSSHLQLRLQKYLLEQREAELSSALRTAAESSFKLIDNERFVRAIFDASPGVIGYLDPELIFRFANAMFLNWFGRKPEQVLGLHTRELQGEELFAMNEPFLRKALQGEPQQFERATSAQGGAIRHVLVNYIPDFGPEGGVKGLFVLINDITSHKEIELQLSHLALNDHLTGLPNRTLLLERLSQLRSQSNREKRSVALLFCDLDGFKTINDTYGHSAGDAVLTTVARRLQAEVRQTDTVARLGGDEFIILLDNPENLEEVERVAERLLQSVQQPISVGDQFVQVGSSIGIATSSLLTETPEGLIERADLAMYSAKCAGKNRYSFLGSPGRW